MTNAQKRQIARWISAIIVAVIAAIFGQEHLPNSGSGGGRSAGPAPDTVKGVARLVDGDSLFVGRDEVRLQGIDAPEGRQSCTRDGKPWACGNAARDTLSRIVGRDMVECRVTKKDQHGRLLAYCSAGGREMNSGMVAQGMAVSYGDFRSEEAAAKRARLGLWGSEFQFPRDWRRDNGVGQ